ncbi:MAG: helix-turn-helix domain-containing protein [Bacteroides sp.]|nr:helix-turn-helix domain-containing protein [Bacteroides sp.]
MKQEYFPWYRLEQLRNELAGMARLLERAGVKPAIPVAEGWVDGQEVMNALHISARTLSDLRAKRVIGYTRLGRKFYYKCKEIDDILQDNYVMYNLKQRKGGTDPADGEEGGRS